MGSRDAISSTDPRTVDAATNGAARPSRTIALKQICKTKIITIAQPLACYHVQSSRLPGLEAEDHVGRNAVHQVGSGGPISIQGVILQVPAPIILLTAEQI